MKATRGVKRSLSAANEPHKLVFTCSDGNRWEVPDQMVDRSLYLAELRDFSAETPVDASRFSLDTDSQSCATLATAFDRRDETLLPPKASLASLAGALRLSQLLQLNIPALVLFNEMLVMEIVRVSGVASLCDFASIMFLSQDLQSMCPEAVQRVQAVHGMERLYWVLGTGNVDLQMVMQEVVGVEGYAFIESMAGALRAKHPATD